MSHLVGGSLIFNHLGRSLYATYNGGETLGYGIHGIRCITICRLARYRMAALAPSSRDNFAASPGAASTGSGMGDPDHRAIFLTLANSPIPSARFQPSETIQTGQAMRYMNAVLGEAEYSFSRRSAFTFFWFVMGFCIFTGCWLYRQPLSMASRL